MRTPNHLDQNAERRRARHARTALAALCCALALPAAHADSRASARLANLSFELVDLDTTDGITPWMEWQFTFPAAVKWVGLQGGSTWVQMTGEIALPFISDQVSISDDYYAAMAGVGGTGDAEGAILYAQATLLTRPDWPSYRRELDAEVNAPSAFTQFSLSPMTALRVTADMSLEVESEVGTTIVDLLETAYAVTSLEIHLQNPNGTGADQHMEYWRGLWSAYLDEHPSSGNLHETAMVSVTNDTTLTGVGYLRGLADVHMTIGPVPEADTALYALAGLASVGAAAELKRQRSRP